MFITGTQCMQERQEAYKIRTEILETRQSKQRELEELEIKKEEAEKVPRSFVA